MTIAILGAAGAIGSSVAEALEARGADFVVVGRNPDRLHKAFGGLPHAKPRAADLETAEGAAAACAGVTTGVITIGLPYTEFHRYPAQSRALVDGAVKAGVKRLLLVTNIYAYGAPQASHVKGGLVDESHPRDAVSHKGVMRKGQEDALLDAARAGKLEVAILRLPDFMGPGAELSYTKTIVEAAIANKTANLFDPINTPHQFVHVPDVGAVVASLLDKDATFAGKGDATASTFHFAGSGIITVEEYARQVYVAAGTKPSWRAAGPFMLRIIGLFDPIVKEFVEMNYLQKTPVNLDDKKLVALIGEPHRTSYADSVKAFVASVRGK